MLRIVSNWKAKLEKQISMAHAAAKRKRIGGGGVRGQDEHRKIDATTQRSTNNGTNKSKSH